MSLPAAAPPAEPAAPAFASAPSHAGTPDKRPFAQERARAAHGARASCRAGTVTRAAQRATCQIAAGEDGQARGVVVRLQAVARVIDGVVTAVAHGPIAVRSLVVREVRADVPGVAVLEIEAPHLKRGGRRRGFIVKWRNPAPGGRRSTRGPEIQVLVPLPCPGQWIEELRVIGGLPFAAGDEGVLGLNLLAQVWPDEVLVGLRVVGVPILVRQFGQLLRGVRCHAFLSGKEKGPEVGPCVKGDCLITASAARCDRPAASSCWSRPCSRGSSSHRASC
jgi:hypothetical protein